MRIRTPGEGRGGEPVLEGTLPPRDVAGARFASTPRQSRTMAPQLHGAPNSTRAGEHLTTALAAAPTSPEGIVLGRDQLSHAIVAHDPVTAYQMDTITSPLTIAIGDIGSGKSSLLKTQYVLRALAMARRRCVVIDKKDEQGEGEYAGLTRRFGTEPIRMRLDGDGSILNPIDPVIVGGENSAPERNLQALIENISGHELNLWERKSLRFALRHAQATTGERRAATLADVAAPLGKIRPDSVPAEGAGAERFELASLTVRFAIEELLETYGCMFDGETSKEVNLNDKLTTFDVSQLPDAGPAVPGVVGVAHGWLMGLLRRERGMMTHFIAEEGWHLLNGPNAHVIGGANVKLARGLGLVMVIALHKPADIQLNPAAEPVLAEAQTIHVFANSRRADAQRVVDLFDLDSNSLELIMQLPKGHHLLKIGSRPEIHVRHVRSEMEKVLTNTDAAMLAANRPRATPATTTKLPTNDSTTPAGTR